MTAKTKIRIGHSPDSDDAFMFWGLASGEVNTPFEIEHEIHDIQTLNTWALEGKLESTAISVHALAYVADRYALLRHGGSFGESYGPIVVSRDQMAPERIQQTIVAVPGKLTSAFLQLQLFFPGTRYEEVPFNEILPAVRDGTFDAGLIIHEGQLTWQDEGLHLVADFGKIWHEETGLPLPLGVNVVRKDLGEQAIGQLSEAMRSSISAGLRNRAEAMNYAMRFARGMTFETSDEFVGMYVNERTLDMGSDGVEAIRLLLRKGADAGLVPPVEISVAD
jgi:1,4-dihydroxy-6-naphthoate synthase